MANRLYVLVLDKGPKPWETGYSRPFRFDFHENEVVCSSRKQAIKVFKRESGDAMRDAAAWKVECEGRV